MSEGDEFFLVEVDLLLVFDLLFIFGGGYGCVVVFF